MSGTFSNMSNRTAVPWWAAFGAPLIGVPVLVAVLALGAARHAEAGVGADVEPGYVTEQAEALHAGLDVPQGSLESHAEGRG